MPESIGRHLRPNAAPRVGEAAVEPRLPFRAGGPAANVIRFPRFCMPTAELIVGLPGSASAEDFCCSQGKTGG